jgi:membrane fusion protein (multidrug efflux system)
MLRYSQLARDDYASKQRREQADAQSHGADAQLRAVRQAVKVTEAQLGEVLGQLDAAKTGPQQVAVREAQVRSADAQVAAAQAALDQAELNLSYTRISAPHDGIVTKRAVRLGEVVQRDQQLGALVFGTPWVVANFKETQLTHMKPGQPVTLSIDAYPGMRFAAHVDSIQRGTGARFSLLPPENATGNFVKVVQRVPVKIVFDAPPDRYVLSLGMSVIPRVDLAGSIQ